MKETLPGDQYGVKETKQRLQAILRGAFSGPPDGAKGYSKEEPPPSQKTVRPDI
jgi:hypothetical protein